MNPSPIFSKINSAVLILYLRGIFNWHLGLTDKLMANRARPSQPISKIAKMALFYQWMKFEIFLGQMTSSEVLWILNMPFCDFIQNLSQAQSMCISMWIIVNKYNYLKNPSQEFKNSFCFRFLWISRKTGR